MGLFRPFTISRHVSPQYQASSDQTHVQLVTCFWCESAKTGFLDLSPLSNGSDSFACLWNDTHVKYSPGRAPRDTSPPTLVPRYTGALRLDVHLILCKWDPNGAPRGQNKKRSKEETRRRKRPQNEQNPAPVTNENLSSVAFTNYYDK